MRRRKYRAGERLVPLRVLEVADAGSISSMTLDAFIASGDDRPLTFEQLPFNHPVYILYSSGTTGAPKCIVHGAGVIKFPDPSCAKLTPRRVF